MWLEGNEPGVSGRDKARMPTEISQCEDLGFVSADVCGDG